MACKGACSTARPAQRTASSITPTARSATRSSRGSSACNGPTARETGWQVSWVLISGRARMTRRPYYAASGWWP
eukprot:1845961-Pyramimonas_sp.AAC.1